MGYSFNWWLFSVGVPPDHFNRLVANAAACLIAALSRLSHHYDVLGVGIELQCTYDPETRGGHAPDGRRVRGTIHWVSAAHSVPLEVRLYDELFNSEKPEDTQEGSDYKSSLNPHSLEVLNVCRGEPSLATAKPGTPYQFERTGYFCVDARESSPGGLVFNRTVPLRDSWRKIERS